jgi:hypothetical protein
VSVYENDDAMESKMLRREVVSSVAVDLGDDRWFY